MDGTQNESFVSDSKTEPNSLNMTDPSSSAENFAPSEDSSQEQPECCYFKRGLCRFGEETCRFKHSDTSLCQFGSSCYFFGNHSPSATPTNVPSSLPYALAQAAAAANGSRSDGTMNNVAYMPYTYQMQPMYVNTQSMNGMGVAYSGGYQSPQMSGYSAGGYNANGAYQYQNNYRYGNRNANANSGSQSPYTSQKSWNYSNSNNSSYSYDNNNSGGRHSYHQRKPSGGSSANASSTYTVHRKQKSKDWPEKGSGSTSSWKQKVPKPTPAKSDNAGDEKNTDAQRFEYFALVQTDGGDEALQLSVVLINSRSPEEKNFQAFIKSKNDKDATSTQLKQSGIDEQRYYDKAVPVEIALQSFEEWLRANGVKPESDHSVAFVSNDSDAKDRLFRCYRSSPSSALPSYLKEENWVPLKEIYSQDNKDKTDGSAGSLNQMIEKMSISNDFDKSSTEDPKNKILSDAGVESAAPSKG
eukprot:TRINITY_DN5175_c0_g1_i4.p1 TRINITY_DN5175_c0_g1~~TRINITY_DN5175_c0_g1_i4.p1  ORF type:complete len:470 (-),score=100.24 TRINITY_DN5175_c0_g1_i4:25-1434(-)